MPSRSTKIKINKKYGAVVVNRYYTTEQAWQCVCECGKIVYKNSTQLLRVKHPSCGCQRNIGSTLEDKLSLKRQIVLYYKTNADAKGYQFELTEEDMFSFFSKNCHYCGIKPSNKVKTRKRKGRIYRPERAQSFKYTGVDRIDSNLGYTLKNCVPCCAMCNISKNNHSLDDWKIWIKRVYSKTFND